MKTTREYGLTDEQVEAEIERLNASDAVALARLEARLRYRRRQYLYNLRNLEKQGKALMAAGITKELLNELYSKCEEDDE
jgi:SOS response regulatory protein OraA/RecX